MKYFIDCRTIEEVKSLYKQLAKVMHPDCGGSTELMQDLNKQYELTIAFILNESNYSGDFVNETIRESQNYRNVIDMIIQLEGIVIEIIGNWIWVSGNTFPVKDALKGAGLHFSRQKAAWYYHPEGYKGKNSGKNLDEIRAKYGSEKISQHKSGNMLH
ncbi:MAG TPA: hypothetical protein VK167_04310 [Flavipsychrobacter sp.]|nr:hypothetical protein [Flavipsychrobacter sp.]